MEPKSQTKESKIRTEDHQVVKHGDPSETSPESRRKEPVLEKYVKRYHAPEKIIGDHTDAILTRNMLNFMENQLQM